MTSTYATRALAYAHRVVSGEEGAGKFEVLACKRYLRDIDRQGQEDFPFILDDRLGSRICQFMELLCHIKGEWAKPVYVDGMVTYARIKLEDWQVFIEYQLFAWVHKDTGLRRFRRSYEEIARKNAKSTRVAARNLYLAFADGEPGAQVYSAATTANQAKEVFDTAREMVNRDSEFRVRFGIPYVARYDITAPETASTFKILNAEASTQDGLNVHAAVVDEMHAHKRRDLWDVIESADGARSQPLISAITTAGVDTGGICYELRGYTIKVLEQTHHDDSWFGIIFTIDDGDDWKDPKVWRKANPNIGISAKLDKLQSACLKAIATPASRGNFLTKHLNVWSNAGVAWMDMEAWKACADPSIREEDFEGLPAFCGMDLAEKNDFAAKIKVVERDGTWYVFSKLYYNELAAQESKTAQLPGWIEEGFVKVSPGNLTDFDMIRDDLLIDQGMHDLKEVAYDPALSSYFARTLIERGLPMVEITQRSTFYTQPLLQVFAKVLGKNLVHDGNPAMTWMVSNMVVMKSKYNELMSPTKDRDEEKIDGPMAMLMALGRALGSQPDDDSFWESFAQS